MNKPAQRCEEQIISLFQDRETLVCRGWILKKMGGCAICGAKKKVNELTGSMALLR